MIDDFASWRRLVALYADYAACVDEGRFQDWPGFFTEDGRYRIVARENHEQGLPLSLVDLQGAGMLRDRVYAIQSTLFHAPYYQRHIVGAPRLLEAAEGLIRSEANYLVIRTKRDEPGEVFSAGRYLDRIRVDADGPRFAERICVYDTELIANSLIYPI